jgi:hypothetical protein
MHRTENLKNQMKSSNSKIAFLSVLFLLGILGSCSKDSEISSDTPTTKPLIRSFSFLASNNEQLTEDVYLDIKGKKIKGVLPPSNNAENLIATFEFDGAAVFVNDTLQVSGLSQNNYSKSVNYTVRNKEGESKSYLVTLVNKIDDPEIGEISTTYINTNDDYPIVRENYKEGSISISGISQEEKEEEVEVSDALMKIRGRGNSTWDLHNKKAYQLNMAEKTRVYGMPKDKRWVFLAEHSDKTLMRNKIAYEMGYISKLDWTPQSVYSEVYLNNDFLGAYHISQKIEMGNNRVDVGETGYLLEIDQLERLDFDDVYFQTDEFLINIKAPKLNNGSTEYNYIKNWITEFENVLKSNIFSNPTEGYQKYIDVDSFVDWYLINEITKNQDARNYSSIYLNVIPGEKIKMGPLWDFDLAFGNVDYSECEYPEGFWVKDNAWYHRLFEDPSFVNKVKTRFAYFRLQQEFILQRVDFYASYLDELQLKNDAQWDVIGNYLWPNPVVFETYEEEVDYLKSWYNQRMDWLEIAIGNL